MSQDNNAYWEGRIKSLEDRIAALEAASVQHTSFDTEGRWMLSQSCKCSRCRGTMDGYRAMQQAR